jgi:hypothetical protein
MDPEGEGLYGGSSRSPAHILDLFNRLLAGWQTGPSIRPHLGSQDLLFRIQELCKHPGKTNSDNSSPCPQYKFSPGKGLALVHGFLSYTFLFKTNYSSGCFQGLEGNVEEGRIEFSIGMEFVPPFLYSSPIFAAVITVI